MEPVTLLMTRKMLLGIKQRAERRPPSLLVDLDQACSLIRTRPAG
jgi:hypothetical protein